MIHALLVTLALVSSDAATPDARPAPELPLVVDIPALVDQAERSYLVQRYDRAIEKFEQVVAANPTIGYCWWRLGTCSLMAGKYERAIEAFTRSHELGAFQWRPLRMAYHGESAWGIAAAHARLGHKDDAIRWTRIALDEGLRDIRKFHEVHFQSLLADEDYRKLVWKLNDVKKLSRDEGMRLDVRFLLHEAKRIHYAPFRITPEAEFDSLAAALEADIPKLSDDQVRVRMSAIMRRLGDGHSLVYGRGRNERLGVTFFQFPEGLYVFEAIPEHADLVGAKVLKIGDCSAEEAVRMAAEITSRDNEMNVTNIAPRRLESLVMLRGLGIVSKDGPVPLEIEDTAGNMRKIELPAVKYDPYRFNFVRQVPGCDKPLPLCLRARNKMYWFEALPDQRAIYFQMNGIGNDPSEMFDKFCQRLFAEVEKPEIDALIVDLRYNGGGDTFTNVPLIEGLIRSQKLQEPGRLFVIIGRNTFSAAQNTTSELERRTKAILVGEPTGSCPNFIGESLSIPLPYSGWIASISDLWWQHSMSMDYRVWTHPQLYAPPTAAAFRAHRDPALEMIQAYRAQAAEKSSESKAKE